MAPAGDMVTTWKQRAYEMCGYCPPLKAMLPTPIGPITSPNNVTNWGSSVQTHEF